MAQIDTGPDRTRSGARTTHRRGRMSPAKRDALDQLGPRWVVRGPQAASVAGLAAAFGRTAPLHLDIGPGTGEATRDWARRHPDHDVVAVELHRPGIVRLIRDLAHDGPANVRVVEADATTLLDGWPSAALAEIRVLFPDPWPKRRHHGRRLVDRDFVRSSADLLEPGGRLHLATDWADYAHQMRAALATEPRLRAQLDQAGPGGWRSSRPTRPVTAYEQRGTDAGRAIVDLVARRSG